VSTLPQNAYSSSVPQLSASNGNLQDDEEIQLYTYAGNLGKKVKARKVPSTDRSKQLLPIQMAEDFKLMAKDAKAAGFTITANSAYRGLEEQIKIFDERWAINYSYGKPKILPKGKGGENQLNNVGKSKGTAAIPGSSPHNRGVAVDIQIGGGPDFLSKFKTDIYKWLKDNAYKYGFFNTGAKIRSTPEAWHWAYIPSQKGKKDAIITPPNSQNTDK
jgi:LAS superfamily LD-carboxypeptidase LdcB